MKKILKNIFDFAAIGIFIGTIVSLCCCYFWQSTRYYPSTPAFVNHFNRPLDAEAVSILLWVIIGQLFGFGSLIFYVKSWSLRKKTVINFLTYYLGFIPLALLAGWFRPKVVNFLIFTLIFLVAYIIIWSINHHLVVNDIEKVNQKVKEKREKQQELF